MTDPSSPNTLAAAIKIAGRAHAGQLDHVGAPYMGHINRVVGRAEAIRAQHLPELDPAHVQAVAWLHDSIEDSDLTVADLVEAGVPEDVVADVVRLTHLPSEPRDTYLDRVEESTEASLVKLADTLDNTDAKRREELAAKDPARAIRLEAKYASQEARLRERLGI